MSTRISALDSVDPLSVALPHGTEVTTRVARLHHGKTVPQGLIGRVTKLREDGGFDIHIAGGGEVFYRFGRLIEAGRRRSTLEPIYRRWLSLARRKAVAFRSLVRPS